MPILGHIPSMAKVIAPNNLPLAVLKVTPPLKISVKPEKKASKIPEEDLPEPPEDPNANVHQDDDYGKERNNSPQIQ